MAQVVELAGAPVPWGRVGLRQNWPRSVSTLAPLPLRPLLLLACSLGLAAVVGAQRARETVGDTLVALRGAEVVAARQSSPTPQPDRAVAGALLARAPLADPARALRRLPGVSVRSYGPGGITTLRYRGLSLNRLAVRWRGLDVADAQLGGSDLGTLAPALNVLSVSTGGPNAAALDFGPPAADRRFVTARLDQGGGYGFGASHQVAGGTAGLQLHSDAYRFAHAPGLDDAGGARLRSGALQYGRCDTLGTRYTLQVDARLGANRRRLANTRFERGRPLATLDAEELWLSARLQRAATQGSALQIALLLGDRRYADPARSLATRGVTRQYVARLSRKLTPRISAVTEHRLVDSEHDSYRASTTFHRSRSTLAYALRERGWRIDAQAELLTHALFGAVPAGRLRVSHGKTSIELTRTARYPLLDDVLWREGGRDDLSAETGWAATASWRPASGIEVAGFARVVRDYLLWLPGQPFWRPTDAGRVHTLGLSAAFAKTYRLPAGEIRVGANATYAHARALDLPGDDRLPFDPRLLAAASLGYTRGAWSVLAQADYTGEQTTGYDGATTLPAYAVLDVGPAFAQGRFDVALLVGNLTQTQVPSAEGFPTPLRRASLNLSYRL